MIDLISREGIQLVILSESKGTRFPVVQKMILAVCISSFISWSFSFFELVLPSYLRSVSFLVLRQEITNLTAALPDSGNFSPERNRWGVVFEDDVFFLTS